MAFKNQNQRSFRGGYRKPTGPHAGPQTPTQNDHKSGSVGPSQALWKLIETRKDPASGTTKTTRILELDMGVLVNTCTRGPAGMCEALQFIAGATAKNFEGGAS